MTERELVTQKAEAFFEDLWRQGDPWEFETSAFERDKICAPVRNPRGTPLCART